MPLTRKKKELESVLENISDGVLFIDNKGTIRIYNRALAEMLSVNEDLTGSQIFALAPEHPVRLGIFRAEKGFPGPYCWERNKCPRDSACQGKNFQFCRCWLFSTCESLSKNSNKSCIDCAQYQSVKQFLQNPKELEMSDKVISVLSSFIEYGDKDEIWEVIVFKNVTAEKLDAVCKLSGALAHELRQPLQIITSSLSLLLDGLPDNPDTSEHVNTIKLNCVRMNSIIEKINKITRYKTKHYLNTLRILDIEGSSNSSEMSENIPD